MKRLLIVSDCFLPRWDGVARFLYDVLPFLRQHFHVTVAAPDFPGPVPSLPADITIVRFPLLPLTVSDFQLAVPFRKKLSRLVYESDIVFTQTIGPLGVASVWFAKKQSKRIVSFIHSIEWELVAKSLRFGQAFAHKSVRWLARWVYMQSDLLLCPTKEVAHLLSSRGVETQQQLFSLGVKSDYFVPAHSRPSVKESLGFSSSRMIIGYHGRIAREKNLPTLVRAFAKLRKEFPVDLLIVGSGIKNELPKMLHLHHVESRQDVLPYLQAMDIYVNPSLLETTSLATLEAMSCALPVVVTPVGLMAQYVKEGVNGLFFPRKRVAPLVLQLRQLLSDSALRERLGKEARATVLASYDLGTHMSSLVSALLGTASEETSGASPPGLDRTQHNA